ncbi:MULTISPECIES: RagB/SusD family nutrient uptake outer membrane protein [unclassified Siphonobacter]|uniref:RagB/SusD family nutrient uptake outer membrane protein n=1 Tax=unclassified Siphonobacter TaxID=2635712 RepID=UPI000CB453A1|nr:MULTISPECIES: RagB/SusD family nutrient uptake outer membrane protein [unclassified Siphonobacter]MDQ1090174.1 hypothetical protein [Siphonobacter sp. SORGH_AS_1065]MDR6197826.1 hypothetical protein [Siphonobacter sp. SORGH_AS_0500]PKK37265.1 hypothetical protein BWI96_07935 [Siphonobacter sp. SORGH_AS_0500]
MNHLLKHTSRVLGLGIVLALSSCNEDKLEPTPTTFFTDIVVFDTPARIAQQVNGLFSSSSIKSGAFLGGRYHIYSDIQGEEFLNVKANQGTGFNVWSFTQNESQTGGIWDAAYASINKVNVFLKGLDDNASKFVPPTFPANYDQQVLKYKAEARFVRAVAYFYVLQFYARSYGATSNGSSPGLPLRLQAETNAANNDLARSTVAEVYAQIIEDLNFAEQNLPLNYTDELTNVSHPHRNSAIAFKTKVYLAQSKWDDVIREADKIVSASAPFTATTGVKHALQANIASVFAVPQTTTESIFSLVFTNQDNPGTQNQFGFYYLPTGNREYYLNPAGILGESTWKSTDARRQFVVTSGGQQWLSKYSSPSPYTDKAPIIRYAEVLLNLAEARTRSTNSVDARAVQLLSAVRSRSDASTQWTTASFPNASALLETILKERRIEFLGEGLRSIDIYRQNLTFPAKGTVPAIVPSDPTYVWLIPASELTANKLMTRN